MQQLGTQNALDIGAAAVALTPSSGANHVIITNTSLTGTVRWRADGTAPTSTSGQQLGPGASIAWMDAADPSAVLIASFKAIKDTNSPSNGTLEVAYFS